LLNYNAAEVLIFTKQENLASLVLFLLAPFPVDRTPVRLTPAQRSSQRPTAPGHRFVALSFEEIS
jgi:hypothetical protein